MTSNPNRKDDLGRGIRSLLQHIDDDLNTTGRALGEKTAPLLATERIPLDQIEPNPRQPRQEFEQVALRELADSIRDHDLVQPLTVIRMGSGKFRLIAGERRLRAARMAGLKDVPVFVRNGQDGELLVLALLENLQREDLNALEVAAGYQRLMEEGEFTQEQVADKMNKDRSTVTNYLRLLRLPADIQISLRKGQITMGHARVLTGVEETDRQMYLFREILRGHLSVRQTEELARRVNKTPARPRQKVALPHAYRRIEDELASHFSTKVTLTHQPSGKGSLLIEFFSDADLDRIYELIRP